jgi:hypothetical protein
MRLASLMENAKEVAWLAGSLSAVAALIESVAQPRGWLWVAARVIGVMVGSVFAVAAAALVVASVRRRR